MSIRVDRLGPGPHRIDPMHCPKCGLSIDSASGMVRGTKPANYADKSPVQIMVCARCEVAIARWDGNTLALDAAGEAILPLEARQSLLETRNQLRLDKALGRLTVPATGP
jgi:hypothetical protein